MDAPAGVAAPESGITDDPEILALLDFEPVPRARIVEGCWTPERQRELVIRLAGHGSIQMACDDMCANRTGFTRLRKHKQADSFNAAIDGAITLARRRIAEADAMVERMEPQMRPAVVDYRRKRPLDPPKGEPLPGQVLNEHGEWEDEASYLGRAEEAMDSICNKLRRSRRLFLYEISDSPVMRAAFEILTDLPVDWEKAAKMQPQDEEPWRRPNMHQRDMLLTAEDGWLGGELVHGPDRKAELLAEINEWRKGEGLPLVAWDE